MTAGGRRTFGDIQELTPIGIRPAIRHAQDPRSSVFEVWMDLVLEFVAVDGAAASASAAGVACL